MVSKSDLLKHAEDLSDGLTKCIRAVIVKHNIGVIEGSAEMMKEVRSETLDEVASMLDELIDKVQKPTPIEKGMRMALSIAIYRVKAMKPPLEN